MALIAAPATVAETGRALDNQDEPDQSDEEAVAQSVDIALVQQLGDALHDKRREAMDHRKQLGIEQDWEEDEEYYQSIDSANPEGETNVGKPVSSDGGPIGTVNQQATNAAPTRSSVFIPLTRPYVDAAAARIADMLLPNDDMPWSLRPTPISDEEQALQRMNEAQGGQLSGPDGAGGEKMPTSQAASAVASAALGSSQTEPMAAGMMGDTGPAAPSAPDMGGMMGMSGPAAAPQSPAVNVPPTAAGIGMGMAPGLPGNAAQAVMGNPAAMSNAAAASEDEDPAAAAKSPQERAADLATKQITDWLIECQYHAEFRKMLENAAKLGTGVLKGPAPEIKVSQRVLWVMDEATGKKTAKVERILTTVPVSRSIDPRNFFSDPACGEDVQRGGYTWEYDTLSARQIEDLLQDESFIAPQLRKVLLEGPQKPGATLADRPENTPNINTDERNMIGSAFGVWYFHGMIERELLLACGVPQDDFATLDNPDAGSMSAIITMINDTVVKASLSSLDQGGFPYDVMPWQRRAGMIWGMGVARQMRTPQRMVNGAARALMDNMGFSSGPLWAIRRPWIKALDGDNTLRPRKGFEMTGDAPDNAKIQDAISFVNVPSMQAELEAIINLGMKMAEDATGLPMLLQGQQGNASDTLGGMTILNNNGSTVLRRIARQADDYVTERHIRRYYYWLLENTDNDAAKGDFQIDARGSTALVDRELSNQHLLAMMPELRSDPDVHQTRLNQEILKAFRIDWKPIYKTAAEKKASPPPAPPIPVMVAQVREQHADQRLAAQLKQKESSDGLDARLREGELKIKHDAALGALDLALRELSAKYGMNTDQIKAMLAKATMTLNTQVQLSDAEMRHEVVQGARAHANNVEQSVVDHVHQLATNAAKPLAEPAGRAQDGHAFTQ